MHLRSRGKVPQALVDAGGVASVNGKDVAQKSDVIITMVPDTPDVEAALFSESGVEPAANGYAALDHSALVRALEKFANFEIGAHPTAR